jgi:uncharacterized membrane protein YkvA (DUF1232 family)
MKLLSLRRMRKKPKRQFPRPDKRKAGKAPSKRPNKRGSSLEARLQTEFSQAVERAKSYVNDRERLSALVTEAAKKAASLPKEEFKETWAYFQTMLRLVRAYNRGDYREVAMTSLIVMVAAIIYVVNPFDLLPDWVPGLGLLDDAFILDVAIRRTHQTLDEFMTWETVAS